MGVSIFQTALLKLLKGCSTDIKYEIKNCSSIFLKDQS